MLSWRGRSPRQLGAHKSAPARSRTCKKVDRKIKCSTLRESSLPLAAPQWAAVRSFLSLVSAIPRLPRASRTSVHSLQHGDRYEPWLPVAQCHGVEQGGAAVAIQGPRVCTAFLDQAEQRVCVAPRGGTVKAGEAITVLG